jgi:SAM-dependent methyltransferase
MEDYPPILRLNRDFTTADSSGSYDRIRAELIRKKDAERLADSKVWKEVSGIIKDNTDQLENVLDIGCGTGRYFDSVYAKNLYGLDGSYEMLERARYHWGSSNTKRYERWATGNWAHSSDWPAQTPWPPSFPPPADEVAVSLTTNYHKLILIQDDVMDFCHKEEYRNKFDFIYSVAMLGITNVPVDPYKLIPLLPNLVKNNAKILLHIDLSGLCRREVSGELDRERAKVESLLGSMERKGTLKKYKTSKRVVGYHRRYSPTGGDNAESQNFWVMLTSSN